MQRPPSERQQLSLIQCCIPVEARTPIHCRLAGANRLTNSERLRWIKKKYSSICSSSTLTHFEESFLCWSLHSRSPIFFIVLLLPFTRWLRHHKMVDFIIISYSCNVGWNLQTSVLLWFSFPQPEALRFSRMALNTSPVSAPICPSNFSKWLIRRICKIVELLAHRFRLLQGSMSNRRILYKISFLACQGLRSQCSFTATNIRKVDYS